MNNLKEKPRSWSEQGTGRSITASNWTDYKSKLNDVKQPIKERLLIEDFFEKDGHDVERVGDQWKTLCPFHSEATPSCVIYDDHYHCFGCGAHGDIFSYVQQTKNWNFKTAFEYLAKEAGLSWRKNESYTKIASSKSTKSTKPISLPVIKPWPQVVQDCWREGVEHLAQNAALQTKIAAWRGWTPELVLFLATNEIMAAPLYYERGIAFRVDCPFINELGIFSTQPIGFHIRLERDSYPERPLWFFLPNEKEHGQKVESLPFILGDFSTAKLLIITEGQWDAITFCHAADWMKHDASWPDGICVIGIRGAHGINPFLRNYLPYWPESNKCLLLPDLDEAGSRWFTSDGNQKSFAEKLAELCIEVNVQKIKGAKDFNEAWIKGLVSSEHIGKLFLAKKFTKEGGQVL